MGLKINELIEARDAYYLAIGTKDDGTSDRINVNIRQAFINAFKDVATVSSLKTIFGLKDANNVRYAMKIHDVKMYRYKDYAMNYEVATKVMFTTIAIKLNSNEKNYNQNYQEA
jgi:hypothetical protein